MTVETGDRTDSELSLNTIGKQQWAKDTETQMTTTDVDRAWNLMKSIRFCMLTTGANATLRSRPMGAFVRPKQTAIYFFADKRAHIDDDVSQQPQVHLMFADPHRQKYVSAFGTGQVNSDPQTIKDLWSIPAKVWWKRPGNPNICIIKVVLHEAEYWDAPGNLLSNAKIAVALATGRHPDAGEHKRVTFTLAGTIGA